MFAVKNDDTQELTLCDTIEDAVALMTYMEHCSFQVIQNAMHDDPTRKIPLVRTSNTAVGGRS